MKFARWLKGYRQEKNIQASGYVFTDNDMLNAFTARLEPPQATLRDQFACCIVSNCMLRYKEDGYSDEAAIKESYHLADFMLEVRDGRVERDRGL